MVLARTVANGCGRLRMVATVNATSSEHTLNPQTPRVKREPLLRIREKGKLCGAKVYGTFTGGRYHGGLLSARGPDDDGQAEARQGRIGWSQVSNHRFMLHGVLALRLTRLPHPKADHERTWNNPKMALT